LDVVRDHSDYSPEQVNWKAFQAYSAEVMAQKLATAFDTALDGAGRGKR